MSEVSSAAGRDPRLYTTARRDDWPVTPRENMKRLLERRAPLWMPEAASEIAMVSFPADNDKPYPVDRSGRDWWGVDWTYVPVVGAQTVTPNRYVLTDITEWKTALQWPDISGVDFTEGLGEILRGVDPDMMTRIFIGHGCFERMHFLMGFENALISLMTEPEACADFFNAFVDFKIRHLDLLLDACPGAELVTYSDDFGTQRGTFFSPAMFEELLLPPLKRLVDHVHSRGKYFCMHSCGKMETLVHYFAELGIEMWEAQGVNDFDRIAAEVGSRIVIQTPIDPELMDPALPPEEIRNGVERFVDRSLPGKNYVALAVCGDSSVQKLVSDTLYRCSLEKYA